jgi:hypothetical protein
MIKITKGNPTSEEIAALLSVLMVARGDTQSRPTGATASAWRSAPLAHVDLGMPSRCERRWRTWSDGWSCVGPAHAPVRQQTPWVASRKVA